MILSGINGKMNNYPESFNCDNKCEHFQTLLLLNQHLSELYRLLSYEKKEIQEKQALIAIISDTNKGYTDAFLTWVFLEQILIKRILIILIVSIIFLTIIIVPMTLKPNEDNENFNEIIYSTHIGPHRVLYRSDWKGLYPKKQTYFTQPAELVVISHSQTSTCNTFKNCVEKLQKWQKKKMLLGYSDLWYNFYVTSESNVYVGRGWDTISIVGNCSISIQVIGNFVFDNFEPNMIDAVKQLIQQGLELKKISREYKLVGENQTNTRRYPSPGINIYNEIKTWQHFDSKIVLWLNY